jgi:hypothetical protein
MATDLTVVMRDEPGELAKLGEVTLAAGVRIRGLAAFTGEGRGFVHALVEDADVSTAQSAFKQAKIRVADTRAVLVVELGSRSLVDVMTALAEANVNVDLAYTACDQKVVIATDDVLSARDAIS